MIGRFFVAEKLWKKQKSRRLKEGRDWKVILCLKACGTVQKCNGRVHK